MAGKGPGHGPDDGGIEQHPGLGRSRRQFSGERFQLTGHERGGNGMDTGHSRRRLRRQASHGTGAMDTQGGEHLEIGLDARPTATVGTRHR